jgi:hypothetical protein
MAATVSAMRLRFLIQCLTATVCLVQLWSSWSLADEFERPPIEYSLTEPANRISELQARLDRGELRFDHDEHFGYLKALLDALDVPVESQMLVFSKTSFQRHRISPRSPRAIYFNDDIYVGFCLSGDVIEVSAVDPRVGTAFYTLDQEPADKPNFVRQTDNCLLCHSSSRTDSIPGHLVRSLFVSPSGEPILSAGSRMVDYTTPLEDRWGGWYVTGRHGAQIHQGNLILQGKEVPRPVENAQGQNVTRLEDRFAVEKYLSPHSDIVALLVLEHQIVVHNRLTKASFVARQARHYEATLAQALGKPEGERLESAVRRMQSAGDDLIEALLMVGEAKLGARVSGTSGFAEEFTEGGRRDRQGRSLREFDLERRVFKYPCSYLIHSPAFADLPSDVREYVWQRLWEILNGRDDAKQFAHLSTPDREAIVQILRDTTPDLPEYWKATAQ